MEQDKKKILDNSNSIAEEFFRISGEHPDTIFAKVRTLLSDSEELHYWKEIHCHEASGKVASTALYLKSLGLGKGDRVGIISNSRVEWLIADLAILAIGGVSVSIYQSLLPKEIAFILHDSEAKTIFAENQEQLGKLEEISKNSWDMPKTELSDETNVKVQINSVITFESCEKSTLETVHISSIFENRYSKEEIQSFSCESTVRRDDLASLVYTSGTTGAPKGVMQTHGNHLSNVRQVLDSGLMIPGACIFLFLPLAHSFARLMGYLASLTNLSVSFPETADKKTSRLNPSIILRDMAESGSDIFPIVPRFLEKIKDQLQLQSQKKGLRGYLLRHTIKNAMILSSGSASVIDHLLFTLLAPMRSAIRKKLFGSRFKYCVSGGAKLSVSVHNFFNALGFPVYEGYGLTETVVATNACKPGAQKIGSVGKVLSPDIEVRLLDDGEITYRGPNISPGYLNRPNANKESWTDDGWFLTGDLGSIDEEGFLYITGRKKEIIVTSGGKNVAPLPIEEKIMDSPLISQAVVIGDGRKFCSAVITINRDAVMNLASERGEKVEVKTPTDCEAISRYLWEHLDTVNSTLASYESIKKIYVPEEEFSIENGLLTPTMKIKRKEVEKKFSPEIEKLYA
jgi:long-chain acyl-CoA synthetase